MKQISLGVFVAIAVGVAALTAPQVMAQERYSVKLTNPTELETYGPGASCVLTGIVRFPESPNSLTVRVRLYRTGKSDFIIAQSTLADVKKPEPGMKHAAFEGSIVMPMEPGPYVLRVDVLDHRDPVDPKKPVATQCIFLKVHRRSSSLDKK